MGAPLFDPWTASLEAALAARAQHDLQSGRPDPLSQHQAAQAVLQARTACESESGGGAVLQAIRACTVHRLLVPEWLSDAFVRRHSRVVDAEVGSWDEAFGQPWPPRTRLDTVRRHRRLKKAIHEAVWQRLLEDPGQSVTRDLFEQVGEQRGISVSGSLAEKLYQEALQDGMPNALQVRQAQRGRTTETAESVGRIFGGNGEHSFMDTQVTGATA